jgi:hypothetical protein
VGLLAITVEGEPAPTSYLLERVPHPEGLLAFCMYKLQLLPVEGSPGQWQQENVAVYNVVLNGMASTCECLGHLRWGRPCRHIAALSVLVNRRLL